MPGTALGLTPQQFQTLREMIDKSSESHLLKVLEARVDHIREIVERLEEAMAASTNLEVVAAVANRCTILEAKVSELSGTAGELRERIAVANGLITRILLSIVGTLIVALFGVLWYFIVEQATPRPASANPGKAAQNLSTAQNSLHTGALPEKPQ